MIIDILREAALEASKVVTELEEEGKGNIAVGRGSGGDVTLLIDKVAEETIIEILRQELGDFKVISEELGEKVFGREPRYTIIIDPVDGSNNAKRDIPLYSVSIAAAQGNTFDDLVAGVVRLVPLGREYYAIKGQGAYMDGSKIEVKPSDNGVSKSIISINFPSKAYFIPSLIVHGIALRGGVVRVLGAVSVEVALLAAGAIDGYIDAWGTLRTVDYAAAYLIAKEAGAKILLSSLSSSNLLSLKERLVTIVSRNSRLLNELIEIYKECIGIYPRRYFANFINL